MTPLVWGSIFGGLAAVILAVSIPYLLTHKVMRDPYDTSEGHDYVRAKRRWQRRSRTRQPAKTGSGETHASPGPDRA